MGHNQQGQVNIKLAAGTEIVRPFVLMIVLAGFAGHAVGGSTVVGQLFPPPISQMTSTVSGLTFDAQPGPLILEGRGNIKRVSPTDASVLGTILLPAGFHRASLEYHSSSGDFFTTRRTIIAPFGEQEALYRVSTAGAETLIGGTGGSFSFASLALDPQENLWALSGKDIYNPSSFALTLYTLSKTTGAATFAATLSGVPGQAPALGIDEAGRFFVSTMDGIFGIDPITGAGTPVTSTGLPFLSHFSDLAFDDATDKWYGVEERRATSPYTYYLREITGMPAIPEPASLALIAAGAGLALRRRRITSR